MTKYKQSPIKTPHGTITMHAPYFDQLLRSSAEDGRLTREAECHALWYYYGLATRAYNDAKDNLVEEADASRVFNREIARQLFTSVSQMYQVKPADMIRFWPIVQEQRMALGAEDTLPAEFKFEFWGH